MKSAKNGLSGELFEPLNQPVARRIFIQRQKRSELVVMSNVGSNDSPQMKLRRFKFIATLLRTSAEFYHHPKADAKSLSPTAGSF